MAGVGVCPGFTHNGDFYSDNSAARLLWSTSGEMVTDARSYRGGAARPAPRHYAYVRAGTVSPTRSRRHQQYGYANGAATELLDKDCLGIETDSNYAGVDHLHLVSRRPGADAAAEGLGARGTQRRTVNGCRRIRRDFGRICRAAIRRADDGCAGPLGSLAWH